MRKTSLFTSSSALILSAFLLANAQAVRAEELTAASPEALQMADQAAPAGQTAAQTESQTTETAQTAAQTEAQASETAPEAEETALVTAAAPQTAAPETTVILHTNDIHGRMEEDRGVIGAAKLAAVVEAERAKTDQTTLVLDAGDAFQGLPISNASQGNDMVKIMNAIGYDAMAVGNHEFDFSLEQAKTYRETLNFPLLSANTYVNGVRLFEAAAVIDKNKAVTGDEVVVIGLTTPETATKTHPNNVVGVTFTDPITEVKKVIEQTEATAAAAGTSYDKYVILAHLGIDASTPSEWRGDTLAQALADYAPLAGKSVVIIDGHSHTVHSATYGSNVTYNQTGSYLNNIGKITLSQGTATPSLISAAETQAVTPNAAVAEIVTAARAAFEAENAAVIVANNPVELNGDRENVRVRETNSGNAIADALYQYGQTGFSNPTDLAVTNGGGIRATIAANQPITRGDIISVLPFGNLISQIAVSGSQISAMFEKSLSADPQTDADGAVILDETGLPLLSPSGGFLQTSGVRTYFDPTAPSGSRVLKVEIFDRATGSYQALDPNRTYYLATNDFLAAGGDGYTMLGGAWEEGPSLDTVFADYLAGLTDLSPYQAITSYTRTIPLDPAADSDGDGVSNLQELINGTDPFTADPATPVTPADPALPQPGQPAATTSTTSQARLSQTAALTDPGQAQLSRTAAARLSRQGQSSRASDPSASAASAGQALPATGQSQSAASLYGLGLLSLAGLMAAAAKRRKV